MCSLHCTKENKSPIIRVRVRARCEKVQVGLKGGERSFSEKRKNQLPLYKRRLGGREPGGTSALLD